MKEIEEQIKETTELIKQIKEIIEKLNLNPRVVTHEQRITY